MQKKTADACLVGGSAIFINFSSLRMKAENRKAVCPFLIVDEKLLYDDPKA